MWVGPQVGEARQISLGGGTFPQMQAHTVNATEEVLGPQKHARLVCEWGLHPLTLLLAAGTTLALATLYHHAVFIFYCIPHPWLQ